MKRETVYSVFRGYKFSSEDWDKFKKAFSQYEGQYTTSLKTTNGLPQAVREGRDQRTVLVLSRGGRSTQHQERRGLIWKLGGRCGDKESPTN